MERLQRYDLLDRIAAGGMGEVFRARVSGEHGFHKTVAVKRILPELARDAEFVVRFVAEAKLTVSLSHANVVQVFDLARAGDELFLVMELVDGTDLGRLLAALDARGEPLPVSHAIHVALAALQGLAYAHERSDGESPGRSGVVHCDISPSNLLLSTSGEVKIADFGVAQLARRSSARGQRAARVMGKLRYMSPEQLRGEPLDGRTDLYALAVVLHESLGRRRLFDEVDADATARAVLAGGAPRLRELRPDVPAALDELVARALSRERKERPASARAMLSELTRIARTVEPLTAPEMGQWVRARLPSRAADGALARDSVGDSVGVNVAGDARSGTISAAPPACPITASYLARAGSDGTAVWIVADALTTQRSEIGERRRWRAGALALGTLAVILSALAIVRQSPRTHTLQVPASAPLSPVAAQSVTVAAPPGTVAAPPVTVAAPPGTVAVPLGTVAAPPSTVAAPLSTVAAPPGTVAAPPSTVAATAAVVAASPAALAAPSQLLDAAPRRTAARRGSQQPRAPGFLNVYADPWAYVSVDGKRVGVAPLMKLPVAAGVHRVRLEPPGARPIETTVRIAAGETQLLDADPARSSP